MKIAFDLDGVLRDSKLGNLNVVCQIRDKIKSQKDKSFDMDQWLNMQTGTVFPKLNPALFSLPGDEVFVITACIHAKSHDDKKRWVKHFFGDHIKTITVDASGFGSKGTGNWGKAYVDPTAKSKMKVIADNNIDVYFDDDPAVVRRMRQIAENTNVHCKIIHFGPWIEEYY